METHYIPEHSIESLDLRGRVQLLISPEHILLAAVLALTALLRVYDLTYNSLFVDEAIYATIGRRIWHGDFSQNGLQWIFGSYLYPWVLGLADQLGGVLGMRLLSAMLSLIAAWFVYLTAERIWGRRTGVLALAVFGFSGPSISLGQQAVYDALSMPLMAVAIYYAVAAASSPQRERRYLAGAGFVLALSILAKYIALLMLPVPLVIWAVLHLRDGKNLWRLLLEFKWLFFLTPLLLLLGSYGYLYFDDIRLALSGEHSTAVTPRIEIVSIIMREIGPILLLGIVGLGLAAQSAYSQLRPQASSRWQTWRFRLTFMVILVGLLVTILMMQIYHFVGANSRALWKHNVYTLILLAPLTAYAITRTARWVRRYRGTNATEIRLLAVSSLLVISIFFINLSLDTNWNFKQSWPDARRVVAYLKGHHVTNESFVLAAGSTSYEYYFDFKLDEPLHWFSTWYMEYQGLTGPAAMQAAIRDCALDIVILDDYYSTDVNAVLQPLLLEAGYKLDFSTLQNLNFGAPVGTRVYVPTDCRSTADD